MAGSQLEPWNHEPAEVRRLVLQWRAEAATSAPARAQALRDCADRLGVLVASTSTPFEVPTPPAPNMWDTLSGALVMLAALVVLGMVVLMGTVGLHVTVNGVEYRIENGRKGVAGAR